MSINRLVIRTEVARAGAALLRGLQGVTLKIGPDRGKITAMLGLGGGQNLLLVVLGINTDKSGKQQQNTVVVGKRGKKLKNRLEPLRARAAQTGSGGAWARSCRRTRWTSSLRGTQSSLVSEMTGRKGRWALTLPLLLLFLLLPFLLFTLLLLCLLIIFLLQIIHLLPYIILLFLLQFFLLLLLPLLTLLPRVVEDD